MTPETGTPGAAFGDAAATVARRVTALAGFVVILHGLHVAVLGSTQAPLVGRHRVDVWILSYRFSTEGLISFQIDQQVILFGLLIATLGGVLVLEASRPRYYAS